MRRRDRQRRRFYTSWQRRKSNPSTDPATVFRELQRRKLADLEDCRIAWERAGDPLAVCAAVTMSDLPEWLVDALLVLLTDGTRGTRLLRSLWKAHGRDALDGLRAAEIAGARSHPELPQTWERAYLMADHFVMQTGYTDVAAVGKDAMKKAYSRVCQGLINDGRYYRAPDRFSDRLKLALDRVLQLIEADVARQRKRDEAATRK